jgi:uncharacterized protein DUF4440
MVCCSCERNKSGCSMEKSTQWLAMLVSVVMCVLLGVTPPMSDDGATIAAINKASAELDAAFVKGNEKEIRRAMTSDHLSVTPYYGGPQSVDDQIASLGDLKFSQKNLDEPKIILLGPAVALRTFTAEFIGTFKSQKMPRRQFVTSVMVNRDGRWVERFYQATTLRP